MKRLLLWVSSVVLVLGSGWAQAAAPGITGPTFNLTAQDSYINQPDGNQVYSWGYGCNGTPAGYAPAAIAAAPCPTMQIPGPTLVVTEGQTVTVTLTNNLPAPAGNTSILFPGFNVTSSCSAATPLPAGVVVGLLTCEAAPGGTVTYTFTASTPGTRSYYSGTQGDLQVEMGMYGAIIVVPSTGTTNGTCPAHNTAAGLNSAGTALAPGGEQDFRLSTTGAAYHLAQSCYDREYLFQFSEMDVNIHRQAQAQVAALAGCTAGAVGCSLQVPTEPYHPAYFLINGRSMPDDMDANYASQYPHQPYNGNPHMHPGEQVLLRVIGQGRWQHPFHEHANHVRILARDGNLLLSKTDPNSLAGQLQFTTTTTPGQAFDGIFYYTGRGLNWDMYGHHGPVPAPNTQATLSTTLKAALSRTGTTLTVASGSGIQLGATLYIGNEQLSVTAINSANSFTVTRGFNSTTAAAHANASTVTFANLAFDPNQVTATVSALDELPCTPDANGYNTGNPLAVNYYEWCADHNKPLQANPFGDVASGGPATLPDPNIFTNGAWYSGSPYLGPDATTRATGPTSSYQPSNVQANPANERGYAFMWHSHNEREITTNNVFPGGMFMMMLVDSREFVIDESN